MADVARMRWRCRRGIRELDLLLERFVAECYPALSPDLVRRFEELLDEADLDILGWITHRRAPRGGRYDPVLELLRDTASRHALGGDS